MSESFEIGAALIGKLLADPALMALVPDGVYRDVASHNAQRFVIVSLMAGEDTGMFGGRAFERPQYLVKAVMSGTSGAQTAAAAARIDALLDHETVVAYGYSAITVRRIEPVEMAEVDEQTGTRWQHRGGVYALMASPAP